MLRVLEREGEGPGFLAHARVFADRAEVHSTGGCPRRVELDDAIRRSSQLLMDLTAEPAHLVAFGVERRVDFGQVVRRGSGRSVATSATDARETCSMGHGHLVEMHLSGGLGEPRARVAGEVVDRRSAAARLLIDHERLVDGRGAAARLDVRSQPAVEVAELRGRWNGDAELGSLRSFVDKSRRFADCSPGRGLLTHCHCHPVDGLVVLHDGLFGVRLEIELL